MSYPNDAVRIVLVETSHPGNIGSAARAMKTMGLSHLHLVKPRRFPNEIATTMASNAADILDATIVHDSLSEAIGDCQWVYGTTARERYLQWPIVNARECAEQTLAKTQPNSANAGDQVALVFGRESSGLTNDELQHCQSLIHIPANPEYSSLNLASAVQILAYEIRMAHQSMSKDSAAASLATDEEAPIFANAAQREGLFQHLEQVLLHTEYLNPEVPGILMHRLRRLIEKAEPSPNDINTIRGIFKLILKMNK